MVTPSNSKREFGNNARHPDFTTLDLDDNAGRPLDYGDSSSMLLPREQTGESISMQGFQAARYKSAVRANIEVKGMRTGDLQDCRKSDIQSLKIVRQMSGSGGGTVAKTTRRRHGGAMRGGGHLTTSRDYKSKHSNIDGQRLALMSER